MINSNELMLGNYVNYYDSPTKVIQISEDIISFIENNHRLDVHNTIIEPIPITEEILEKCGFERHISNDTKEVYFKDDITIILPIDESRNIYHLCLEDTFGYVKNINHLHQLQNSYLILTGEQLNIEL